MEDLLPVKYVHMVFRLPAQIADIAHQNKAAVYGLLFKASSETLLGIAADPKHPGARIGKASVLHIWGSAMTHHPHVHVVVPGRGLSADGTRWIGCRPAILLPVNGQSRLFRRLFLEGPASSHKTGRLRFVSSLSGPADPDTFATHLAPLRKTDWVAASTGPSRSPKRESSPAWCSASRPSMNRRRNNRANTLTWRKNPGLQATHLVSPGNRPPPGTIM